MAMTIKELRKALRGLPEDAKIYWADHDQSAGELNAPLLHVCFVEPDDDGYTDMVAEYGAGQPVVVLRP